MCIRDSSLSLAPKSVAQQNFCHESADFSKLELIMSGGVGNISGHRSQVQRPAFVITAASTWTTDCFFTELHKNAMKFCCCCYCCYCCCCWEFRPPKHTHSLSVRRAVHAVSYTHLDVYKRQVMSFVNIT